MVMNNRNRRRMPFYISLMAMVVFIAVYFFLRRFDASDAAEVIVTILAIIAGVAFWLEYHKNGQINEAQFVVELNNSFITDEKMNKVEHKLEKYYYLVRKGQTDLVEEYAKALEQVWDIRGEERQDLVNYLVHLESVATLVKDNVIRIKSINDLMGYRFFIATNNPVVQRLELAEYKEFYRGIYEVYPEWAKTMGGDMPMSENRLVKSA